MAVRILGTGCCNCVILDRVTREAVAALALNAGVERLKDYPTITRTGVMTTPPALDARGIHPPRPDAEHH